MFKLELLDVVDKFEIDKEKIIYSPRFIHLDEISIFFSLKNINSAQENILKDINKVFNYQFENENLEIKIKS